MATNPPNVQIPPAVAAHDLATFDGWVARAAEILAGTPDWTALVDSEADGYIVSFDGYVFACAAQDDPEHVYTEDDLIDFDRSAWNGDAWDGETPEQCRAVLESPVFTTLRHAESE